MILCYGPHDLLRELTTETVTYEEGPFARALPLGWAELDHGLIVLVGPLRMAEHDELRWPSLPPRPELEYLEPYLLRIGTWRPALVSVMGHQADATLLEVVAWWKEAQACGEHGWGPSPCRRCRDERLGELLGREEDS